jgi:hypothetical protein
MDGLFVTDLDGTLLRPDRTVSPYTVQTLNAAIAAGVGITYATARSQHSAGPLVAAIDFRLPAIVFNGALIVAPDGAVLHRRLLDREVARQVLESARQAGASPMVFGFAGGREVALHSTPVNPADRAWVEARHRAGDRRLAQVERVDAPAEVVSVQCIARLPELEPLVAELEARLPGRVATCLIHDVYLPEYYQLQVCDPEANKGAGVRWLAESLGVAPAAVTVFGDNANDLPMFAAAGRRLAVANAEPDVRAAADAVLGSNGEDAVARYVARVLRASAPAAAGSDGAAPPPCDGAAGPPSP